MSRTKQELVDFYAKGLLEFADLSPTQYHAVHTALAFACSEIQDNLHAVYMKQLDGAMTLHNQVAALQESKQEAEEEIGRLCSQLQALEAKQAPAVTIHPNGTHPAPTHQVINLAAQLISIDAEAAQEAAVEAPQDPTPAAATDRHRPQAVPVQVADARRQEPGHRPPAGRREDRLAHARARGQAHHCAGSDFRAAAGYAARPDTGSAGLRSAAPDLDERVFLDHAILGANMDAAVGSSDQALSARRDAWQAMSPAARRRMVRQGAENFARWAKANRQLVDSTVVEKA